MAKIEDLASDYQYLQNFYFGFDHNNRFGCSAYFRDTDMASKLGKDLNELIEPIVKHYIELKRQEMLDLLEASK